MGNLNIKSEQDKGQSTLVLTREQTERLKNSKTDEVANISDRIDNLTCQTNSDDFVNLDLNSVDGVTVYGTSEGNDFTICLDSLDAEKLGNEFLRLATILKNT